MPNLGREISSRQAFQSESVAISFNSTKPILPLSWRTEKNSLMSAPTGLQSSLHWFWSRVYISQTFSDPPLLYPPRASNKVRSMRDSVVYDSLSEAIHFSQNNRLRVNLQSIQIWTLHVCRIPVDLESSRQNRTKCVKINLFHISCFDVES